MNAQSDKVLSATGAFKEVDQPHYSLGGDRYLTDAWHGDLVRKEMNVVLESLMVALHQELGVAFDSRFGTSTDEWVEIPLLKTMRKVVGQGSSRFTVGLPLCES
jgi:hypothetical protein